MSYKRKIKVSCDEIYVRKRITETKSRAEEKNPTQRKLIFKFLLPMSRSRFVFILCCTRFTHFDYKLTNYGFRATLILAFIAQQKLLLCFLIPSFNINQHHLNSLCKLNSKRRKNYCE